jgi:hypothetical protein
MIRLPVQFDSQDYSPKTLDQSKGMTSSNAAGSAGNAGNAGVPATVTTKL